MGHSVTLRLMNVQYFLKDAITVWNFQYLAKKEDICMQIDSQRSIKKPTTQAGLAPGPNSDWVTILLIW